MRIEDKTLGYDQFYNIENPYTLGRIIVYGERDMGWYEYLIVDSSGLTQSRSDKGYAWPEIALRDALIEATHEQVTQ